MGLCEGGWFTVVAALVSLGELPARSAETGGICDATIPGLVQKNGKVCFGGYWRAMF
jgi:uncharacterized protein (DUF2141 family)